MPHSFLKRDGHVVNLRKPGGYHVRKALEQHSARTKLKRGIPDDWQDQVKRYCLAFALVCADELALRRPAANCVCQKRCRLQAAIAVAQAKAASPAPNTLSVVNIGGAPSPPAEAMVRASALRPARCRL